jgi:hypothetical protein
VNQTKHTPEPWIVSDRYTGRGGPLFTTTIAGKSGKAQRSENFKEQEANVARAVACVNACTGMTDPEKEVAELRKQRDELLAAVKALLPHVEDMIARADPGYEDTSHYSDATAVRLARAAIKNAGGGQ